MKALIYDFKSRYTDRWKGKQVYEINFYKSYLKMVCGDNIVGVF